MVKLIIYFMASRSLTLNNVHNKLKSFEEPIVNGIINRYHLKKDRSVYEITPSLDFETIQTNTQTNIKIDMDNEIIDIYLNTILPMITGEKINKFYVQDQLLLDLISCRVYYGKEIAEIKFRDNMSIFLEYYRNDYSMTPLVENPTIEYAVLKRAKNYEKLIHGSDLSQQVESIFATMIELNKKLQVIYLKTRISNLKIGYLGPDGTFASQITKHYFKKLNDLQPHDSHLTLFKLLNDNNLDIIVVPARNNITGLINGVDFDEDKHYLIKMIDFNVVIDLLGRENYPLETIEKIYSHPQTYAEAYKWLYNAIPHAKFVPTLSTASASLQVKNDSESKSVALSSRRCAEKLGLHVIKENIVDNSVTTFYIVAKK